MVGAAAVGLISAFLPALTMTLSFLGTTTSDSLAVWWDWRGKLDLLAYVGIAVTAGMMLRTPDRLSARPLAMACLIAAGVALLAAVWLPLSVRGGIPKEFGSISVGFGCYLNVLTPRARRRRRPPGQADERVPTASMTARSRRPTCAGPSLFSFPPSPSPRRSRRRRRPRHPSR